MGEAVKPSLAQRIDEIIRDAFVDVVQEAREEGWRDGYAAGRIEVRREMNTRLRALILEEDDNASVQQPPSPSPQPLSTSAAAPATPHATTSAPKLIWLGDWRTEDRKKVFVELYESGTDMTEIRLTLADIAGPRVPDKNAPLWAWVAALKLRRKSDATVAEPTQPENQGVGADRRGPPQDTTAPQQPSRPPAIHPSIAPPGPRPDGINPKAKVIDLPPPAPNGKIYTSFYNIRAWAGVYGITYDGTNIDKVNKLRTAKSMPPLVQEG